MDQMTPRQRDDRPGPVSEPDRSAPASGAAWLRDASEASYGRLLHNVTDFFADRQLLVWTLALVIGIGVAYAALAFRTAIGIVQLPWLGTTSESVYGTARHLPWYVILLAPAVGGLIVGILLERFVPGRRAHGVADVIEARAVGDCKIPLVSGLWGAALSVLTLGSGASAGREGPMVHLGATIASRLEDLFS